MAAWGNLLNIFENPPNSDSNIPPSSSAASSSSSSAASADPSFEMFGELCHRVNPPSSPCPRFDKSFSWNASTTSDPATHDAFEIFGELCYKNDTPAEKGPTEALEVEPTVRYRRSYSDARPSGGMYPPPITTIGRCGKPRVYFKSYRKDGRFVLREIRIPTQQLLHSTRENGRLTMRVMGPNEDEGINNAPAGRGEKDEEAN